MIYKVFKTNSIKKAGGDFLPQLSSSVTEYCTLEGLHDKLLIRGSIIAASDNLGYSRNT